MTATITPVARHTSASLVRAVAGEKVAMDTGTAPLAALLQLLADRDALHLQALHGQARINAFAVAPGGTSTSFSAEVVGFRLVVKDSSGTAWEVTNDAEVTFSQAHYAGGTLPNNAWVYAYLGVDTDGTTLLRQLSTTAPEGTLTWKSDAIGTRRYVGCFRTGSAGAPFPAVCVRGRYLYRRSGIANVTNALGSNGLRALDGATAVGHTVLSLASRVPPHARVALLYGQCSAGTATSGTASLNLYTRDSTTSIAQAIDVTVQLAGESAINRAPAEIEVDADSEIGYSVTTGGSVSESANLDVMGFLE